jgi:hypothetical protein
MLNFAIQNKNIKLIKLMDGNNLLRNIENVHCIFFLEGFQFLCEKGYIQLSNTFFQSWDKVLSEYLMLRHMHINDGVSKIYVDLKNSYTQFVQAFHTSSFWRRILLDNFKIDVNLPSFDIVLKEELAKIEKMKCNVVACMPQIPKDVLDWIISPMF